MRIIWRLRSGPQFCKDLRFLVTAPPTELQDRMFFWKMNDIQSKHITIQEFLCPFCSSALFHPTKLSEVKSHLERNFKHTVLHEDHHMWRGWAAEFLHGMLGRPSSLVRIIITGADGLNICCDTEAHLVCPCEGLKHHFTLEFIPAWEDLGVFCL